MKAIKAYVTEDVLNKQIELIISQMSEREKEVTLSHALRKYYYLNFGGNYRDLAENIKKIHGLNFSFINRFYYVFLSNYSEK